MALIKCPFCGKEMSERATNCPQCNKSMEEIKSALQKPQPTNKPQVEEKNDVSTRLKEEQAALQKQILSLQEEEKQVKLSIANSRKDLENLKSEKEKLANSISQEKSLAEKNADSKVQALNAEIAKLQEKANTLREEAKKQQEISATSKVELESLKAQIVAANKELKDSSRMSKKDRIITWCLIAACVGVAGWIVWMVLSFNGII